MSLAGRNAAHYKVPVKKLPKATNTETVESRYWKAFKVRPLPLSPLPSSFPRMTISTHRTDNDAIVVAVLMAVPRDDRKTIGRDVHRDGAKQHAFPGVAWRDGRLDGPEDVENRSAKIDRALKGQGPRDLNQGRRKTLCGERKDKSRPDL